MPLKVTLELIPRGDESRKLVVGTLYIENDGTGDNGNLKGIGNYDYKLYGPVTDGESSIPNEFWDKGRLENFNRQRGYWSTVKEVLNNCDTDYDI